MFNHQCPEKRKKRALRTRMNPARMLINEGTTSPDEERKRIGKKVLLSFARVERASPNAFGSLT
jgi:hypothetical protein